MKKISSIVRNGQEYEFVDETCRKLVYKLIRQLNKIERFSKCTKKIYKQYKNSKRSNSKKQLDEKIMYVTVDENDSIGKITKKPTSRDITNIKNKVKKLETNNVTTTNMVLQTNNTLKETFSVIQKQLDICENEIQKIKSTYTNTCINKINLNVDNAKSLPIIFYRPSNDDYFTYILNYNIVDVSTMKTHSLSYLLQSSSDKETFKFTYKKLLGDKDITFYYEYKEPFMYIFADINIDKEMYLRQSITILDGIIPQITYKDEKLDNIKKTKIKTDNEDELDKLKKYVEKKFREINKKLKTKSIIDTNKLDKTDNSNLLIDLLK